MFYLIEKTYKKHTLLFLLALLALIEIIHVTLLFGGAELIAGGDNYIFLQTGKPFLNPYAWDNYVPLGGRNYSIPNLTGLPLYSSIFSFLDPSFLQRILIFSLYFLKLLGFVKLARLMSKRILGFSLIPACLLFGFNAFASLNPFSLIPLAYGAYLPLSLYYFIRLHDSKKINLLDISKLVVLSIVFSFINSNPALSITVFIPQGLYFLVNLDTRNRYRFINLGLYYLFFAITNVWWALPLINYYVESAKNVLSSSGWFVATGVGDLFQNFRFIGQWGWYGSGFLYKYYPYSKYYDSVFIVLATFTVIFLAFFEALKRNDFSKRVSVLKRFWLLLAIFSLFLINGAREPFGLIYKYFFGNVSLFKIFREPFTKFSELYVLPISLLFLVFLNRLEKRLTGPTKKFAFLAVLVLVFLSVKPALLGENIPSNWNGNSRTLRVNVPGYWEDFEDYADQNLQDARVMTLPKSYYGTAWNWKYGFTSADDLAVNFLHNGNNVLRNPLPTGFYYSELAIERFYDILRNPKISKRYLSILGVDYILQENDLDWRYSGSKTYPPSIVDKMILGLGVEKVKDFGVFAEKHLYDIPNDEPNRITNEELYPELNGRPILSLYKVSDESKNPKFHSLEEAVFSSGSFDSISYLNLLGNTESRLGIFVGDNGDLPNLEQNVISSDFVASGVRKYALFSLDDLDWEDGWAWPIHTSVNPESWEYRLVEIKEYINLKFSQNHLDRVDDLIWLAAKRASEIDTYPIKRDLRDKLFEDFLSKNEEAIRLLSFFPVGERDEDFWGMVGKLIMYLRGAEEDVFLETNLSGELLERFYNMKNEFIKWVGLIANPLCGDYCYDLYPLVDGEYEIYIYDENYGEIKDLDFTYKITSVSEKKDLDLKEDLLGGNEDLWKDLGKVALKEEEQYKVNLYFANLANLLSDEWYVSDASFDTQGGLVRIFTQFLVPNFKKVFEGSNLTEQELESRFSLYKDVTRYKYVESLEGGNKYTVSFDYAVGQGRLGLAVVESSINPSSLKRGFPVGSNVSLETGFGPTRSRFYEGDEIYWRRFSKDITLNSTSKSLYVFFYTYPGKDLFTDAFVKNVSVARSVNPEIIARHIDDTFEKKEISVPDISYTKINPTKYIVKVFRAENPFVMVFNETFNDNWKIFSKVGDGNVNLTGSFGKLAGGLINIFKIELAFNSTSVFLDSSTFETWGKESLFGNKHYIVNGYANSWLIDPGLLNSEDFELIVEFTPQKHFYVLIFISGLSVLVMFIYIYFIKTLKPQRGLEEEDDIINP